MGRKIDKITKIKVSTILCVVFLIILAITLANQISIKKARIETIAKIEQIKTYDLWVFTVNIADIQYVANGEKYNQKLPLLYYNNNEEIKVYYNYDNPREVESDILIYINLMLQAIILIIFFVGISKIIKNARDKKEKTKTKIVS